VTVDGTPFLNPADLPSPPRDGDESLVADARAAMTPAQMVERKLVSLLKGGPLPVSQVRMVSLLRGRGRA
jgi:hypothetical protein